jgi:phospholipase/carboxylesterase
MRGLDNGTTNDASDAPLVFGIHGRGDTPESFSDTFHAYGTPARFYFPRAPTPYGEGYTWFSLGPGTTESDVATSLGEARDALHARIVAIAGHRKYAIVGFSQGGFLAYAFAAKYPGEVACAIPIAGALPATLRPRAGSTLPVVRAFHGDADARVDLAWDRDTLASFVAAGGDAKLFVFPGVAHRTTPKERSDVYAALDTCLATTNGPHR